MCFGTLQGARDVGSTGRVPVLCSKMPAAKWMGATARRGVPLSSGSSVRREPIRFLVFAIVLQAGRAAPVWCCVVFFCLGRRSEPRCKLSSRLQVGRIVQQ